ncbi:MAG TPA: isoleucine--tRNA ligase, partial [Anaerolineae bacterium]|nr:isoleucine--tRNA ligase [Anaerolineae bacterium]
YAKTTWYIETTRLKDRLVANNEKINWYPSHIKEGRFGNWLANNVDWALGRERYWGTPLPVWECEACRHQECIGGIAELEERTGRSLRDLDLHRPYVDRVTWPCAKCGGTMRRVPEVIDCWFDSGAMPVAQWHYPFENQELFREQFPADFICEAVDQTRGWFYSLHAISTLLFDEPCFLNCVCLGLILDAEGEKMSKSRGNVVDPWSVLNVHGADALRWYLYTASPPGHDRRFSVELVGEVVRKFLLTLWNTYAFFVTYANIDGWTPSPGSSLSSLSSLDRWILSELHTLIQRVDTGLANYDVAGAARPIGDFVENLSNWYVRRSRRRFWRPAPDFSRWEQDEDKNAAYATLYECLVTLSKLLAPFTPFVAEEIYQNLVRSADQDAPESVHLCDFPVANPALMDEALMANMRLAMRLASLGHAARNRAGIKLRQPLSLALVKVRSAEERAGLEPLTDQLLDELNVKALHFVEDEGEMVEVRVRPVPALLGPKYGALLPRIQSAIAAMDASALARQIRAGQGVEITLDDRVIELLPEELGVELIEKEGYAVAEEGGYLVGVATTITQKLKREGLARELVRRIQIMRKDAGFRIEEHITTYYQAEETLEQVMADWGAYIQGETLSTELVAAEPPPEAYVQSFQIEGERITLGVRRKADPISADHKSSQRIPDPLDLP